MMENNKQTIKEKNAAFNKLTKAEKRVAIAKDVLEQLDLKKYYACSGTYFKLELNSYELEFKEGESLQEYLVDNSKVESCSVCAIGSIFASKVRLSNKFNIDHYHDGIDDHELALYDHDMEYSLNEIFSEEQYRLMEVAFEGNDIIGLFTEEEDPEYKSKSELTAKDKRYLAAIKFYDNYRNSEDRMRGIMLNIIENKGKFKP